MEITEVAVEGLKREYKVVVAAADIEAEVARRLEQIQRTARLPGFRPGKVPVQLLRQRFGRSVLSEVLQQTIDEGSKRIIRDHDLRPALKPRVEITSFEEGKDLEFTIDLEVLPEVPEVDLGAIELVRYVADVREEDVARALKELARQKRSFRTPEEPRPAQLGDLVVFDVTARKGEEVVASLSGEGREYLLGAGRMPEAFDRAIVGKRPGERFAAQIEVPKAYGDPAIAGATLEIEGVLREVKEEVVPEVDDALAREFGAENLERLKDMVRARLEEQLRARARERMKRQLLDRLAEQVQFEVPERMVELEFEIIWRQLLEEMQRTGTGFDSLEQSEEELRAEYRRIAERRVRLGLILSDIGNRNNIQVDAQELQQAVWREAARVPERAKEVLEYFRNHPEAVERLRAPLFEDKVVDFIFELAKVREESVSPEELFRDEEEESAPPRQQTEQAEAEPADEASGDAAAPQATSNPAR